MKKNINKMFVGKVLKAVKVIKAAPKFMPKKKRIFNSLQVFFVTVVLIIFVRKLKTYKNQSSTGFDEESITFRRSNASRFQSQTVDPRNLTSKCDVWQPIGKVSLRYKVYSAYFDDRQENFPAKSEYSKKNIFGYVRVNTILPLNVAKNAVYCHYHLEGKFTKRRAIDVVPNPEAENTTFISTYVICALFKKDFVNSQPSDVGITYEAEEQARNLTSLVKIRYPLDMERYDKTIDGIAICGGPLQKNYGNALRLVEHIETYRLLGVNKQYFYIASVNEDVKKVLEYYKGNKDIEIFDFDIENAYISEKEIRYYAMFNALTDCIYRTAVIDNFKYAGVTDVDEIIMPIQNESLLNLVKRHDESVANSFTFYNTFFFKKFGQDYAEAPDNSPNDFLYSQVNTRRNARILTKYHYRTKYILKTRKTFEVGMHHIYRGSFTTQEKFVPQTEAMNFHYRDLCLRDDCRDSSVEDKTARKFVNQLWKIVNKVCGEIFRDGVCPFKKYYRPHSLN